MRFYYDNKFNFLGFSYNLSMFGAVAGVVAFVSALLVMTVFMPLYPIWYYLAMKNWDKLVVMNPADEFFHFSGVKPRVFDMTRSEWKMLLVVWVLAVIAVIFIAIRSDKKEKIQKEQSRIEVMRREQKAREDSIRYIEWHKAHTPRRFHEDRQSPKPVRPSEELDYYDRHFDDYHDDPEDLTTYPDEIFDFYTD